MYEISINPTNNLADDRLDNILFDSLLILLSSLGDFPFEDLLDALTSITDRYDVDSDKIGIILIAVMHFRLNDLKGVADAEAEPFAPNSMKEIVQFMYQCAPTDENCETLTLMIFELLRRPTVNINVQSMLTILLVDAMETRFEEVAQFCFMKAQFMAMREFELTKEVLREAELELGKTGILVGKVISE